MCRRPLARRLSRKEMTPTGRPSPFFSTGAPTNPSLPSLLHASSTPPDRSLSLIPAGSPSSSPRPPLLSSPSPHPHPSPPHLSTLYHPLSPLHLCHSRVRSRSFFVVVKAFQRSVRTAQANAQLTRAEDEGGGSGREMGRGETRGGRGSRRGCGAGNAQGGESEHMLV